MIKVFRQGKAEDRRNADRNIAVPRKIKVNIQRVANECRYRRKRGAARVKLHKRGIERIGKKQLL